jgi:hypothetical protein
MQAQAEAAIKDFFGGPPGEKLKTAATAQLTLALLTTFWVPNLSGALAVLGLLSVTLSNSEFLRLVRGRQRVAGLLFCLLSNKRHNHSIEPIAPLASLRGQLPAADCCAFPDALSSRQDGDRSD